MKILIGFDGAEHSAPVLDTLKQRIWPRHSQLKFLTIVKPEKRLWPLKASKGNQTADRQYAQLESALKTICSDLQLSHETVEGEAQELIAKEALNWEADMVIVGCRPEHPNDPLLLGSVSQNLLDALKCPVLVAKQSHMEKNEHNILVPLEKSPVSKHVMDWLSKQRYTRASKIKLVCVLPPMLRSIEEGSLEHRQMLFHQYAEMERTHQEFLGECKKTLEHSYASESILCQTFHGEAANCILDEANAWPADLIVMGSHGEMGLQRILSGSISRSISIHAGCSVEVVK